jgi:hypothetical protein
MSLAQIISGAYTCTYNAKALGYTADGWRLSHSFFKRLVTGDVGGDTPLNAIYRGREQFLVGRLIEAMATGVQDACEPYATAAGTNPHTLADIGSIDVGYTSGGTPVPGACKSIVLTAVSDTPAYILAQATFTFSNSILAEGHPVDILMAPDLRDVPVRFRIYPSSTGVFGTET